MKNKPNGTAIDESETAEESNSTNLPQLPNLSNEGFWDQENREIQSNGSYDKLNTENFNTDQSNRFAIGSLDKQVLILAVFRSLFA